MKKTFFLWLLFTIATMVIYAQKIERRYLDVGDKLPDISLGELLNYNGAERSLGSFRGKLLILDFWATWCGPCVGAFKKNDSLKREFSGKVQFLPVTYEAKKLAGDILSKIAKQQGIDEPYSIVSDTRIRSLFNFRTIPHYVWVDKDGIIIAQTSDGEVTRQNINAALSGNTGSIFQKERIVRQYEFKRPLFSNALVLKNNDSVSYELFPQSDVIFSSKFTKYVKGLTPSHGELSNGFVSVNSTVGNMYRWVAGKVMMKDEYDFPIYLAWNRTTWEVNDDFDKEIVDKYPRNLQGAMKEAYKAKYYHCFEITVPEQVTSKEKFSLALSDLNRYFGSLYGIKASIEKRRVKCLLLERTSDMDKLSGDNPVKNEEDKFSFNISNTRFDYFLARFSSLYLQLIPTPIINETGYEGSKLVTMQLNGRLNNVEDVGKELAKYDLRFREDYREIDMIVISSIR